MVTEKYLQQESDGSKGNPPEKNGSPTQKGPQRLPRPDDAMVSTVPPELLAAWTEYMKNGYKNNEKMFKATLNAFMKPYYLTIYMYVTLFIVGILLFVFAVVYGFTSDEPLLAVGFAGLSVISFLVFFIRQPVQALEENLEFISWLGVAFNTYWTRLMYMSDTEIVQEELKAAADDFMASVEKLIKEHARLRMKRPGDQLTEISKPPSVSNSATKGKG